jgi:uncharacterized protein YpbB
VISTDGEIQYSIIVKVESNNKASYISVFQNPVIDKTIRIHFINQKAGSYKIKLINELGQLIYNNILTVDGANVVKSIIPGTNLIPGGYQLVITDGDKTQFTEQVIVR